MLSGLTNYLPETALTVFDNLEFFIRIVLAAILGALVGLERSKRQKEAGVRTHCIIACTSALFMILSKCACCLVAQKIVRFCGERSCYCYSLLLSSRKL